MAKNPIEFFEAKNPKAFFDAENPTAFFDAKNPRALFEANISSWEIQTIKSRSVSSTGAGGRALRVETQPMKGVRANRRTSKSSSVGSLIKQLNCQRRSRSIGDRPTSSIR